MSGTVKVYSVNDATGKWTQLRAFQIGADADAESYALQWFGDPARKRSFAWMCLVDFDYNRREIVRGTAA